MQCLVLLKMWMEAFEYDQPIGIFYAQIVQDDWYIQRPFGWFLWIGLVVLDLSNYIKNETQLLPFFILVTLWISDLYMGF